MSLEICCLDLWAGSEKIVEDAEVIPIWRKCMNTGKCLQEFNEPGK